MELLALGGWRASAPPGSRDGPGLEATWAPSRSGGPGAWARELSAEVTSGLGRWEPEVASWTLRSGVKSGVERAQDLHMGPGWKGRGDLRASLRGLGVGGGSQSPGTGVWASRGPGLETTLTPQMSKAVVWFTVCVPFFFSPPKGSWNRCCG